MIITRQSREIAPEITEILTRAGGLNIYGQPRFRAIWGHNRWAWVGGEWTDKDENGNFLRTIVQLRQVCKYAPYLDYWYIEKWCPPEMYGSPRAWEAETYETLEGHRIPALGPYPHEGDYELSWRVCTADCPKHKNRRDCIDACDKDIIWQPLELTTSIAEEYVRRVMASEKHSDAERLAAIQREQERQRKEITRINLDDLSDVSPFIPGSFSIVPKHYDAALGEWRKEKAWPAQQE